MSVWFVVWMEARPSGTVDSDVFARPKEEAESYIKNCQEEIEQVIDTTNLLDGKEGD